MSSEFPTRTSSVTSPVLRSSDTDHARFPSGVVLANRYRIVALAGRGGMGEVYRADDLKLGQVVALKFLPLAVATDPSKLARLFAEARLAREVTHPNVCRVHDVGEVDGQHFLTMEYVDGEDLASLLRRIGHLPRDKGLEIARQICAGLAAAHERGVLHRDLKPSNVMIDGRGRARLTDFGLAITTGEPSGGPIAGTPAYMAPEQRAGEPVTVRSDLYALGLVLFELFTGRPAFRGQADAGQRREPPPAPSTFVPDLHGSIDRTVLGCLETESARRPPSALAVAASLPGGDPLAALVAAGETPPPEMVAAAGAKARVSSRFAVAALALVLIGMPLVVHSMGPLFLLDAVPLEKSPEVLADRASELAIRLGAPARPAWRAYGFRYADGVTTADGGETPGRSPIVFWYRQGARPLETISPVGTVSLLDPPPGEPGMVTLTVDTRGRLVSLRSVATPAPSGLKPSWDDVLSAAGLDPARMRPVPPSRLPPVAADERRAWESTVGDPPVHVEGASLAGVPAWLEVGGEAIDAPARRPKPLEYVFSLAYFVSMAAGLLLARRNMRLGRGDRRGAGRLAATVFLLRMAAWMLQAPHTTVLPREQDLFMYAVARALYGATLVWVLYVAIEPTVRRHWPGVLISWSRVLSGRLRDPLVGRDLLAGSAAAIVMALLVLIGRRGGEWLGGPLRPLLTADLDFLLGARRFLGWALMNFSIALMGTLFIAVTFVGFRLLLRRTSGAVVASVILLSAMWAPRTGWSRLEDLPVALAIGSVVIFGLLRFGFLATVVTAFLVTGGQARIPFTMDLGAWYGQATLVWFVLTYGIAIFGFAVLQQGRAYPPAVHED
jgi:hypothetical protein